MRRELIKAWQAINRATPTATSLGVDVDVAPGDATQLRLPDIDGQTTTRPAKAWPEQQQTPSAASDTGEVSVLLAGASRVLMAARLADAPQHARVQALLVQAIELAAQISRTIAARQDATAAQHRAAEATAQAAATARGAARGGWQFTKTGADVIQSARAARAASGPDTAAEIPRPAAVEQQPEQGR